MSLQDFSVLFSSLNVYAKEEVHGKKNETTAAVKQNKIFQKLSWTCVGEILGHQTVVSVDHFATTMDMYFGADDQEGIYLLFF